MKVTVLCSDEKLKKAVENKLENDFSIKTSLDKDIFFNTMMKSKDKNINKYNQIELFIENCQKEFSNLTSDDYYDYFLSKQLALDKTVEYVKSLKIASKKEASRQDYIKELYAKFELEKIQKFIALYPASLFNQLVIYDAVTMMHSMSHFIEVIEIFADIFKQEGE